MSSPVNSKVEQSVVLFKPEAPQLTAPQKKVDNVALRAFKSIGELFSKFASLLSGLFNKIFGNKKIVIVDSTKTSTESSPPAKHENIRNLHSLAFGGGTPSEVKIIQLRTRDLE